MATSVFGIGTSESQVRTAIDRLKAAGFSENDISVLFPDKSTTRDFAIKHNTKVGEGTAIGGVTGGAAGMTVGLLAGLGALAIPGLGPFLAAGPIMAALAGGAAGSMAGGLVGALVGMGIPEFEAKRFEGKVKSGGILVSVHSENGDETKNAKKILDEVGLEDVTTAGEAGTGGSNKAKDTKDFRDSRTASDMRSPGSVTDRSSVNNPTRPMI
ncbi:MAG: general stress protein [Phycisphaerales bacterium]|nr:general stress protein [Phycisphaerales bacterium]